MEAHGPLQLPSSSAMPSSPPTWCQPPVLCPQILIPDDQSGIFLQPPYSGSPKAHTILAPMLH
jgi:hypothetical protein